MSLSFDKNCAFFVSVFPACLRLKSLWFRVDGLQGLSALQKTLRFGLSISSLHSTLDPSPMPFTHKTSNTEKIP